MVMFDDLAALGDKLADALAELLLSASRAIQRSRNGGHEANATEAPSTSGQAEVAVYVGGRPARQGDPLSSLISWSAPLIVCWCAVQLTIKRAESQAKKMLKAKLPDRTDLNFRKLRLSEHEIAVANDVVASSALSTTLSSIGGLRQQKAEIQDIITLACSPAARQHGLQPPRGVLLSGVPGTGKTMLAKAIANESGATFINVMSSTMNNKWVGETEKYISAVFSLANKLAPSIIFIDEVDGFLRTRNGMDSQHTLTSKTMFMTLWDGLLTDRSKTVMVLAVTNRPGDLDPAIMRRLPRQFEVGLPSTADERWEILCIATRGFKLDSTVDLRDVARRTVGYSGSDLDSLCQAAQTLAARDFARDIREEQRLSSITASGSPAAASTAPARTMLMRAVTSFDFELALRNVQPVGDRAQASTTSASTAPDDAHNVNAALELASVLHELSSRVDARPRTVPRGEQ